MRLLKLTQPTPEQNLALDEALLVREPFSETLRVWESQTPMVVLGRSSRRDEEVNLDACHAHGIPVLRRVSGGASIVTGPGCLMYAVTLDVTRRPILADLSDAHRFVLQRVRDACRTIDPTAEIAGTSDLAAHRDGAQKKFAGNSLRHVRSRLLYHGALLYDFDLPLISRLLRTAPRQPEYRRGRDHTSFVTNLGGAADELTNALAEAFRSTEIGQAQPSLLQATAILAEQKYGRNEWNESR